MRIVAAVVIALAYVVFTGLIFRSHRRRRQLHIHTSNADGSVLVAYASQTGFAEQLARQSAQALHKAGVPAVVAPLGALNASALSAAKRALFVVSTTGEGDAPDSASAFARKIMNETAELAPLRYGMLALGDREYKNFCGFGRNLHDWLRRRGAEPLFEPVEVDNGSETAIDSWREHLSDFAGNGTVVQWNAARFDKWTLVERERANPDSAGAPTFYISLKPLGPVSYWEAGDIAEIRVRNSNIKRDFSVASLPQEGRLDLLVRQYRRDDGTLGAAAGWLTEYADIGTEIEVRIRSNDSFHAPDDDRPMILIGNGTGIAGLRSLLKTRISDGHRLNWLIFGERNAARDFYYQRDIRSWQAGGFLPRLDLAFSRDQSERIYVQHKLLAVREDLRSWINDGATVYICGSLKGMASGVEAALTEILGTRDFERLVEEGRYHRDVY